MRLFVAIVVTMLAGQLIHRWLDRSPQRGTVRRHRELGVLWVVGGSGFWTVVVGLLYLSPRSIPLAPDASASRTLVHWELAWADIALGVLLLGCVLRRNRGTWMDASVLGLTIINTADAGGNLLQILSVGQYTSVNVWAIPTELVQVVLAIVYLRAYRRLTPAAVVAAPDAQESEALP